MNKLTKKYIAEDEDEHKDDSLSAQEKLFLEYKVRVDEFADNLLERVFNVDTWPVK